MKEVGLKRAVDAAKEFLLQKHRGHKQHGLSSDCKGLQLRGVSVEAGMAGVSSCVPRSKRGLLRKPQPRGHMMAGF